MGRNRKSKTDQRLPPYVYLAKGRYVWREYKDGKLGREVVLCPGDTPIAKVWAAHSALIAEGIPHRTLRWLFEQYQASPVFQRLAVSTRADYAKYARRIADFPLRNGDPFGSVELDKITPGTLRKWMDKRLETSGTTVNRELAFMGTAFGWALERDIVKSNPAKGVRKEPEKPRDRYVTDHDYQIAYAAAAKYPYLQPIMELAYLCRMRLCEVLDLTRANLDAEGVRVVRRKGSKANLTLWTPRLRAAVDAAQALSRKVVPIDDALAYLIPGDGGGRMRESTVQTAWQRIIPGLAANGELERFTLHDLKAKGISDTEEGERRAGAGHMDGRITERVYNRKLVPVKPSGKE
ncbi:Phage integrase family protein [Methylomagnum ishizawai]|uniref:Phage integrase family protein n=1 Tax=Methylomagnum ishizawai TaxID=1760988 RepID=A0A1Y6D2G6_9GAMM|nr:tyrosine-type recombinase/integrase [Methylomagnum ishizawai]SMF96837.1 Phage integrase family protein [Methylomagnum ishizawai]